MKRIIPYILFIALTLGGGFLLGQNFMPGAWADSLAKPSFNPPDWVFGPVWSFLYLLIGIAGARLWNDARDSAAMKLWWVALVINFAWTPVYFGAHMIGAALVVITLLLLTIVAFIRAAWPIDRVSAWLFVPYLAWVSFATALNASIFLLNR